MQATVAEVKQINRGRVIDPEFLKRQQMLYLSFSNQWNNRGYVAEAKRCFEVSATYGRLAIDAINRQKMAA